MLYVRRLLIILSRTGKDIIDADEQEWLAKEEADRASGKRAGWLYRHTLGYLF
jgi:amino acid transporter